MPAPKRPPACLETLHELMDLAQAELAARNIEPARAGDLAARIVGRIAREFGGSLVYLPKGLELTRRARDRELVAAFDGTTRGPNGIAALSRRYGLSVQAVYRTLARHRAAKG